jgi:predicted permease
MHDSDRGESSLVIRTYRRFLRLLPFEFRADFGRDMEQAFADENEDVRSRRSTQLTIAFWIRTLRDFARTAPRQHWDILRQDLRVGTRMIARSPGFALAAILTLALGIGGSTGIFSVVYAVVLRPLSFPESERVVRIGWRRQAEDRNLSLFPMSFSQYRTLEERTTAFETLGASHHDSLTSAKGRLEVMLPATEHGQPYMGAMMASASLFRIFGAKTVLGRLPNDFDERAGASPVAVLSHSAWTTHYGRDPAVIGQTLTRHFGEGRSKVVTIVGVLAPGAMRQGDGPYDVPAWGTLDTEVFQRRDDSGKELQGLVVFGRIRRGVSVETARAEVGALTPQLVPDIYDWLALTNPSVDLTRLRDEMAGRVRAPLLAFLGAVCCLLLVASVNVASLVLARAMARRQEFAARLALGARPLRLARQLVTEGALLAIAGGCLGLGVAWACQRGFVAISPAMPRLADSGIGTPALVFAFCAVLIATSAAGTIPALQASRGSVLDGIRRVGGSGATLTSFSRPLAILAATEVALVLVLLAGTGLLVNSFGRLMVFDLGFDTKSVIVSRIERNVKTAAAAGAATSTALVGVARLSERSREMLAIDDEIVRRVSAVPGVVGSALTGDNPFGIPYRYGASVQIAGAPRGADAALRVWSPSTLDTVGMKVIAGRWFSPNDRGGTPYVVVVSESMVQQFWNGRSPVGERLVFGRREAEVVGVVNDIRDRGARQQVRPTLYVSALQIPPDPVLLVIRISPGVEGIEKAVAAELSRMGGRIKAGPPQRLEDISWRQLADARFLTLVLSVFTVLTVAVALVGVHGVMRFMVNQRTRELGIRRALGATPRDLLTLVIRQAFRFALPGCALGLLGAILVGPGVQSLLFGISPSDPATLVGATALLIVAIGVGAYLPARRASAVDPALSLRAE